ncbi:unnamed protein product [Nesidiocoris tenuis]|uniref:Uncharacterized protein n=1 Tax=Nesidiocoris tenuis TaxID=355587 RepID=A0A6H5GBB8_9HEMI|nr:unnamed protein product [Nesidiocoris tenuis]
MKFNAIRSIIPLFSQSKRAFSIRLYTTAGAQCAHDLLLLGRKFTHRYAGVGLLHILKLLPLRLTRICYNIENICMSG